MTKAYNENSKFMDNSKAILLYKDQNKEQNQRHYNEHILPHLNRLKRVYEDCFGVGSHLQIVDIQRVWNTDADAFLRHKLSLQIEDVEINGIKLNSEKVLGLMNSGQFKTVFTEIKGVIQESMRTISIDKRTILEFDPNFFKMESAEIHLDEEFFKDWSKKKCMVYTKNDTQVSIYNQLVRLRDSVNILINIAPSKITEHEFTTETLKLYPKRLVEETYLGKMLIWNGQAFEMNYNFVLAH